MADFTIIIADGERGWNSSDNIKMELTYEDVFTISCFITYSLRNSFNHAHATKLDSRNGSCVFTIEIMEDITELDFASLRVEVLSLLESTLIALGVCYN